MKSHWLSLLFLSVLSTTLAGPLDRDEIDEIAANADDVISAFTDTDEYIEDVLKTHKDRKIVEIEVTCFVDTGKCVTTNELGAQVPISLEMYLQLIAQALQEQGAGVIYVIPANSGDYTGPTSGTGVTQTGTTKPGPTIVTDPTETRFSFTEPPVTGTTETETVVTSNTETTDFPATGATETETTVTFTPWTGSAVTETTETGTVPPFTGTGTETTGTGTTGTGTETTGTGTETTVTPPTAATAFTTFTNSTGENTEPTVTFPTPRKCEFLTDADIWIDLLGGYRENSLIVLASAVTTDTNSRQTIEIRDNRDPVYIDSEFIPCLCRNYD